MLHSNVVAPVPVKLNCGVFTFPGLAGSEVIEVSGTVALPMVYGAEFTDGTSEVVETLIVRAPADDGFVTLLKVMRTVRPAGMPAPLSSPHWIVRPAGMKQNPMSGLLVVSTTVAARFPKPVPAGKVRSMRLLATLLSAPLAD